MAKEQKECKRCHGDGVDNWGEECQACNGWGYDDEFIDADDDPSWDAHKDQF